MMDNGNRGLNEALFVERIKRQIYIVVLVAALVFAVEIMLTSAPHAKYDLNNEACGIFETEWQYSTDGNLYQNLELPAELGVPKNTVITVKNTLPNEYILGGTLLVRTSQQSLRVFVGGKCLYSTLADGTNPQMPSSAYHFVRIPFEAYGKELTVELSSPYQSYEGLINQIYIGSKSAEIFFLFRQSGLRLCIGLFVFTMGILLVLTFVFARGQTNKIAMVCLGAFFACAGYWVMAESKLMQFAVPYPILITNTSMFALTLLPVFSGFYYYSTYIKSFQKAGKFVLAVTTVSSFVLAVSVCIDYTATMKILPIYLILIGIYTVLLFSIIVYESIKNKTKISASLCGVIGFILCAAVEIVMYFVNINGYHQSNFITIGLLFFCLSMVINSMQDLMRVYKTAVKVNVLSGMVYTDSLTNLQNRTAFLQVLADVDIYALGTTTVAMYDVNNLKLVNDTMGHQLGDDLLRHCAQVIQKSLRQEDVVYRIGGDEFVAIIHHDGELNDEILRQRLFEIMEAENKKPLPYVLSIACGYATFTKGTDKTLYDALTRADKNMYACKKIQKEKL